MKHTIQSTLAALPEQPTPEFKFFKGRRWKFDYAWPRILVAWEIEGGSWKQGRHNRPVGFRNDCEKYSNAAILGWCVIRTTTDMITSGAALDLLERALMSGTHEVHPLWRV